MTVFAVLCTLPVAAGSYEACSTSVSLSWCNGANTAGVFADEKCCLPETERLQTFDAGSYVASSSGDTLQSVMAEMENDVANIATEMERLLHNRCSIFADPGFTCPCGLSECHSEIPRDDGAYCVENAESQRVRSSNGGYLCTNSYSTTGQLINADYSVVNYADPATIDSASVRENFCISSQMDSYWRANFINNSNAARYSYVGFPDGLFRIYPAYNQNRDSASCTTNVPENRYDPTIRPWYVAATSGPKDIILVLDVSGSMSQNNRLGLMKEAASSVLNTLTIHDRFGVIVFGSSGRYLGNPTLQPANKENVDSMINLVENLGTEGTTNFRDGIEKAFTMLASSRDQELSTGCQAAILFLTDGADSSNMPVRFLKIKVANNFAEYGDTRKFPVVLTFTLGSGASQDKPRQMACETNGIHTHIADGGDLRGAMAHYYNIFSAGLREARPTWVAPYDYSSGGRGTTVSTPVFYSKIAESTSGDRQVGALAGVVAMDIYLDRMQQLASDADEILNNIINRGKSCSDVEFSCANLQELRDSAGMSGCSVSCEEIQASLMRGAGSSTALHLSVLLASLVSLFVNL